MSEAGLHPAVPRRKPRLSWRVLGSLLLAAAAMGIVFAGMEHLSQTSGKQRCRKDLVSFSRALMNYLTSQGRLPPAYLMDTNGRRMHSWRPFLIPFVDWHEHGGSGHKYRFDEPWDSLANTRFRNETGFYEYYSCPFYAKGARDAGYLCVVGGTLWPVPKMRDEHWNMPHSPSMREGGVLPNHGKVLLLVEVLDSDIPWTKPEDINLSELASLLRHDFSGDGFRRRIRRVVAVDASGTPFILDPVREIKEIRELVESEAAGQTGQRQ